MGEIAVRSLSEIAKLCGGVLHGPDAEVFGVSTDTRSIGKGALFIALDGENFDGHMFVSAARSQGALGVLALRVVEEDFPHILVPNTLKALQTLANGIFEEARLAGMRSVAITGSNGKTSTKEMVAGLLVGAGMDVHATPGNWNNHIGLPLTICNAPRPTSDTFWVLEMGANQPGDIDELVHIAPADCRVVTSIGAAHLERLGNLDGVRRAKSEIFGHATRETVAVVPFDERDRLALKGFPGRVFTTGEAQNADIRVLRATAKGTGQDVVISSADMEIAFDVSVPGRHNASNLATAIGVLEAMGVSWKGLGKALGGLSLPGGRLRWEERGAWKFLNDAYNANPTSVRASYQTFIESEGTGPRVAVIGEMKELGNDAAKLHADLARSLAGQGGVDLLVFVGPFASTMLEFADEVQGEAELWSFATLEEVADALKVKYIDTHTQVMLFLKASRGARLERLMDALVAPHGE